MTANINKLQCWRSYLLILLSVILLVGDASPLSSSAHSTYVRYQFETLAGNLQPVFSLSFKQIQQSKVNPDILFIVSASDSLYKYNQTSGERNLLVGCDVLSYNLCIKESMVTNISHLATSVSIYITGFYVMVSSNEQVIYISADHQLFRMENKNITLLSAMWSTSDENPNLDGMHISDSWFRFLKSVVVDEDEKTLYLADGQVIRKLDVETGILKSITTTGDDPVSKFDGPANQTVLKLPQKLLLHNGFLYGNDAFSLFKINIQSGWLTVITGTINYILGVNFPAPKSGDNAKNSTLLSIRGFHIMEDDSILIISGNTFYQIDQKSGLLTILYNFEEAIFLATPNLVFSLQKVYKLNRLNWSMETIIDSHIGAITDGSIAKNRKFFDISALTMNETTGDLLFSDSLSNYNLYKVDKDGRFFTVNLQMSNVSCWNSSIRTDSSLTFNPVSFQLRNSTLYVANSGMHSSIQKFDLSQQGSSCFYSGSISSDRLLQQGSGLSMLVNNPTGLYCNINSDEIFVADTENHRILKYISHNLVQVIAGTGKQGFSGDGGLAIHAQLNRPHSISYDRANRDLYIADSGNHRIRKISSDGTISTILGTGSGGFNGDGLPPLQTQINFPKGVTYSPFLGIAISDTYNHRVRLFREGNVSTILGTGTSGMKVVEDNPTETEIISPFGLVWAESTSSLYIADQFNHRILHLQYLYGSVAIIAGTNLPGYNGDGMKANLAKLFLPSSVVLAPDNTILIADTYNNLIRKISNGIISSFETKIGLGQSYQIKQPIGLCLTLSGPFVTTENAVTSLSSGYTSNIIGGNGDGMNVYYADVNPTRMILSPFGNEGSMIFSESNSNRIRYVDSNGIISTIVGCGVFGYMGDKYPSQFAFLASPTGIALNPITNDLIFCDTSNNRIRIASINELNVVDTIAGTGNSAYDSEVSDPLLSPLNKPRVVATFSNGDIVIGDTLNNLFKMISRRDGKIRAIGMGFATDMYVTKDNIIIFSSREELIKMVPYCDLGYQLVEKNTDCIPVCFGLTGNLTCTRNGECTLPNTCKCSPDFTGKACEIPICFGLPSNSSNVCNNGNGTCVSPNKCVCNDGFYGDQCQYPLCFSSLIEESCGGINRGRCVHRNKCECKDNFTGRQCEYRSCLGKSEVDQKVCNGNGRCGSAGKCECNLGYSGADCSDLTQVYAVSITAAVILLILIILILVSSILGWFLYKRNRRDRKIIETELSLDERLLATTDLELSQFSTSVGSGSQSSSDDSPSFVIPLHKLGMDKPIRRLGEGGMGSVFMTKYNGMIVAVKVFDLNNFNISEEDFRNEAILLSRIRHPNIITFYGVSSSPTKRFIVMECLDQSLEKFISKLETKLINLSLDQKLKMLLNIANGIEYLHTMQPRKIIHRDLKPQNILLDSNGNCKVCDFGLSKSISQGTISTITNQLGTFYYMSPEMFDIEAVDPTYATAIDIYSFSIIGWQLLFESKDPYVYNSQEVARKLSSKLLEHVTSYQLTKLICENNHRPAIPFNSLKSCREWCLEFLPTTEQENYSIVFKLCQLIKQCWQGNPKLRPSIEQIVEQLQTLEQEFNKI